MKGKPSSRRLPKEIKDQAIRLYREKLQGFGPTLASAMRHYLGEMIQIDSSQGRL